jgi:hypothetical protein
VLAIFAGRHARHDPKCAIELLTNSPATAPDHRYECLLTVKPLNLIGGVGSAANATDEPTWFGSDLGCPRPVGCHRISYSGRTNPATGICS